MVDLKTGKNLSRRDLLKYASITIGCGVAGSVFGGDKYWMPRDNWVDTQGRSAGSIGGLQRGLGARVGMMGGKQLTARDYVQRGLIAMWDGIENAGWGTHNTSANIWKDLTGNNYDFLLGNRFNFNGDSLIFTKTTGVGQTWIIPREEDATLEVCGLSAQTGSYKAFALMHREDINDPYMMFSILPTNNRGFQFSSNDRMSMFADWYSDRWSVAGTFVNGSRNSQYYNGEFIPSNEGTSIWTMGSEDGNACIGYSAIADTYPFIGYINSIRVYNRALSAEEIAANYAVDKTRFGLT